jgi:type IV pilus assembly protein PilC
MRGAGIISAGDGRLLELGLRGGMTDSALAEIARRKERDARDTIDRITGRIEPALVITASVLIGVILFSVMLPLMGLMVSME